MEGIKDVPGYDTTDHHVRHAKGRRLQRGAHGHDARSDHDGLFPAEPLADREGDHRCK